MKKSKTLIATLALVTAFFGVAFGAHAQEIVIDQTPEEITSETSLITTETPVDPNQAMIDELAALIEKEQDPETGAFTRFILRFKIKQLENQLNIKKALQ